MNDTLLDDKRNNRSSIAANMYIDDVIFINNTPLFASLVTMQYLTDSNTLNRDMTNEKQIFNTVRFGFLSYIANACDHVTNNIPLSQN